MPDDTNKSAGTVHWTRKGGKRLFLWEKPSSGPGTARGTILFVHGSSEASTPDFDLQVPGRPHSSAMDWFAARGFDTWCVDMEGYGRSDKDRSHNSDIATGAADCEAAARYIRTIRSEAPLLVYGISSGALRAAVFAQDNPGMVKRLALDAFVYTGAGSRTLAERREKLPQFLASTTRPLDRAFIYSMFERDHPGAADRTTVEAFADAVLALDSDLPTGTYADMCSKLPVVDPLRLTMPTLVMRGQYDGIAGFDDLIDFFVKLPCADKQFAVMPGIAHSSFLEKNYLIAYHILLAFFTQPEARYTGNDTLGVRRSLLVRVNRRYGVESRTSQSQEDAMKEFDRITHNPKVMGGKPTIRGMRVTVGMIVRQIGAGHAVEKLLADYPYLERADIQQALRYAAWRIDETELTLTDA